MAREIHDTLAHTLTSLIIQLEACKLLSAAEPSKLPAELGKAQELSRSGFSDVKRSISALRPQAMEGISFFESIMAIVQNTMDNTRVNIVLDNALPTDIKLTSRTEIVVFRVIQESITNSIRHGHAGEIRICISKDNNRLQLTVKDNGTGCTNIKKGYGMQGIRERVGDLGGVVEFSSIPGKGFTTAATIPYEVADNENQSNDR
jgi:signal transduction histidine kinase